MFTHYLGVIKNDSEERRDEVVPQFKAADDVHAAKVARAFVRVTARTAGMLASEFRGQVRLRRYKTPRSSR